MRAIGRRLPRYNWGWYTTIGTNPLPMALTGTWFLVVFGVLASYVGPLTGLLGAYQDRSTAATELTQLRRENAALRARADSSQGPNPAEAAARRLGMVSPGEHSYFVKGLASH